MSQRFLPTPSGSLHREHSATGNRRAFLGNWLGAGLGLSLAATSPAAAGQPPPSGTRVRLPKDITPAYPRKIPEKQVRAKLLELLGIETLPKDVPFTTEATEKTEDGLLVTRLTYRNLLGESVPAVLIEPAAGGSRRLGGIVCMSGTSGTAQRVADPRFHRPEPRTGPLIGWGRELARRGFVTLSPTLKGTTARAIDDYHRDRLVAMLAPYGRSLNGVMVDEALRGARILAAGARVDPQRIGLTGMSLGGGVAWYGMACDPGIRTAVPICGSVGSMAAVIHQGNAERHGSHWFMAQMLRYFDFPQIVAACIAPRPFMFVAPTMDEDMPRAGVEELIREVRPVYEAAGHPERFKFYQPETKHVFLKEFFELMVGWFRKYC